MLPEKENTNRNSQVQRTLRISFSSRSFENLDAALGFFLPYQGIQEWRYIDEPEKYVVETSGGEQVKMVLDYPADDLDYITFHTDDCLRDYHYFLKQGIEFLSRPEYHNRGLIVHFLDRHDRIYSLLEERTYLESEL